MARTKQKYDVVCRYGKKIVGHCSTADGEALSAMFEQCGNSAARVLREHAHFSPELKGILEKIAALQVGKNRPAPPRETVKTGLYDAPGASPWGEVQHCEMLCPGVFMVSTAGHGGTMVAGDMTAALSPAARKCGMKHGGYLCFEEDCQENVVLRELLDKRLWDIPARIKDRAAFEENINKSLREYNPEYWRSHERGKVAAKNAPAKAAVYENAR